MFEAHLTNKTVNKEFKINVDVKEITTINDAEKYVNKLIEQYFNKKDIIINDIIEISLETYKNNAMVHEPLLDSENDSDNDDITANIIDIHLPEKGDDYE